MFLQRKNRGWKVMGMMLSSLLAGQTVALEAGGFYPSIGIALMHDDNIFRSDTNKKSSTLLVITPKVRLEYDAGEATQLAFQVDMERGVYFASSNDNYLDVALSSEVAYLPTQRLGLHGRVGYQIGHDARGTGSTAGAPLAAAKPSRFHVWSGGVGADYDIGEQQLRLNYLHEQRRYDNNRATTVRQDRKSNALSAGLSMRVAPNTAMTFDLSLQKIDYDVALFDSTELGGSVGVRWDATYQTAGFAKIGWQKKDLSSAVLNDAAGTSWEVGVNWRPLSYSTLQLSTSRDFGESDGVGSYKDIRGIGLAWKHGWSDVLNSRLSLDTSNTKYGGDPREDKDYTVGVGLEYRARPWLSLGGSLSHSWRDSNAAGLNYKDNQIGVNASISM